jgi:hypothetical protein
MGAGVGTDGSKKWRIVYCRSRRSARLKKSGFSRAFGVEDLRDRAIEQLAVGGKNILGVSIAVSDLCIKIGCWRRGAIGIMEFRAEVFSHGLAEGPKIAER